MPKLLQAAEGFRHHGRNAVAVEMEGLQVGEAVENVLRKGADEVVV